MERHAGPDFQRRVLRIELFEVGGGKFYEAEGQCTNLRCHFDISNCVTLRQAAGTFEGA